MSYFRVVSASSYTIRPRSALLTQPLEIAKNSECIVVMNPVSQATTLLVPSDMTASDPKGQNRRSVEEKTFTFDNSFWSFNTSDLHYANQENVYNALGEEFLDHNFEGYHTCIFAYGQTGSGKSYTMMGTPEKPGIIPRTCEDLFQRIESNTSPHISYTVRVSYFEVYNEHVRDLLSSPRQTNTGHPNYLKIREHPSEGPYVKDLTEMAVRNYNELLRCMRIGDASRTTASTKMNDTSSRSHAVFTIVLKQIHNDIQTDSTTERTARIRLVDLAGSERANRTEATGQRLREGANINKSLTTLGRVIAALSTQPNARGKPRKDVVPYRDSILTWLLKDSLGGNSKTAMIACISPTDYDETLSTLRYADQAKRIRTRAVVNQGSASAAERDAQLEEMQAHVEDLQRQVAHFTRVAQEQDKVQMKNRMEGYKIRDEKLEEYAERVQQMQRRAQEDRLVYESKIRQLVEKNETLSRHLKLACDSIKNPIPGPTAANKAHIPRESMRSISGISTISVGNNLGIKKRVSLGFPEDQGSRRTSIGEEEDDTFESAESADEEPPTPPKPYRGFNAKELWSETLHSGQDPTKEEMSEQNEDVMDDLWELFDELALFKMKVKDDIGRFRKKHSDKVKEICPINTNLFPGML
ncbi:MAG: hypothetical protein LQ340_001347 [Diploschistes diacapsis]|nr:MAG: hypothetical protein LQ340_001347 [Diploschistes diacapsis]